MGNVLVLIAVLSGGDLFYFSTEDYHCIDGQVVHAADGAEVDFVNQCWGDISFVNEVALPTYMRNQFPIKEGEREDFIFESDF